MTTTRYLHPMIIDVRPYPWWERFRVGLACLLFGTVTFRGEIRHVEEDK